MKRDTAEGAEQRRAAGKIMSIIEAGRNEGIFDDDEAEIIRNIFKYGDKDVKEIMTHRKDIAALSSDERLDDALMFILTQNFSRFPIFDGDIDTIIGTIHLRDAVKAYLDESLRDKPLRELTDYIRPVGFVPETKEIDGIFKMMQEEQAHIVIVVDEYGQTSGLATMEDIIEEIMGNILDEYDEEEILLTKQKDGSYLARGIVDLSDLSEELGIEFEEGDYETLNGFLVSELDHIPTQDENAVIEYAGWQFRVLNVSENMIQAVRITRQGE